MMSIPRYLWTSITKLKDKIMEFCKISKLSTLKEFSMNLENKKGHIMETKEFKTNIEVARLQIIFLSGQKNSREVFQVYPDSEFCRVQPQILIGTIDEVFDQLTEFNRQGAGVALVVNQTDLKGRAIGNVTHVRALFTDDDNNLNKFIALDPPSFIVRSKNGPHKYYLFRGVALEHFSDMQKNLAAEAETDSKVCDLGRAMRLAGFYHMKDPSNPFIVNIESQFMNELMAVLHGNSL